MDVPVKLTVKVSMMQSLRNKESDILLVNPYSVEQEKASPSSMDVFPPLGILYLASYLKTNGYRVSTLDGAFLTLSDIKGRLKEAKTGIIGISANLITRARSLELIKRSAASGRIVIAGGPDPSIAPEPYFNAGARFVVKGEGEETLLQILQAFESGGIDSCRGIPGLLLSNGGAGEVFEERELMRGIENLPFPDFSLVDVERYMEFNARYRGYSILPILSARGCPYKCSWCAKPIFGDSYRLRGTEEFIDEMSLLQSQYQPDYFRILDDVFTTNKDYIAELARKIDQRGLHVKFECLTRTDCLDSEVVRNLKKMGCTRVWCGIESGSQRILDAMNKGTSVEQSRQAARLIHDQEIQLACFVMIGYPGETRREVLMTAELVERIEPDKLSVSIAYPLPGTAFYNEVKGRITDGEAWRYTNEYRISYRRKYPEIYYRYARKLLLLNWKRVTDQNRTTLRNIWDKFTAFGIRTVFNLSSLVSDE